MKQSRNRRLIDDFNRARIMEHLAVAASLGHKKDKRTGVKHGAPGLRSTRMSSHPLQPPRRISGLIRGAQQMEPVEEGKGKMLGDEFSIMFNTTDITDSVTEKK